MNKQDLQPHQVVLDVVLRYTDKMPREHGHAFRSSEGQLMIAARNHHGAFVGLSVPTHLDGTPFDGDAKTPPNFVLYKLAPTVWKLAPSVLHPMLHAYVTVIEVPDPAPWEVA